MKRLTMLLLALSTVVPLAAQQTPPDAATPTPPQATTEEVKVETGEVNFGVQGVDLDEESAKFDEYRDVPEGFFMSYMRIMGEGLYEWDLIGERVLQEDAHYFLSIERGGYELIADFQKIPHRLGNNARSILNHTARDVWEMSDTLQHVLQDSVAANRSRLTYPFLRDLVAPTLAAQPFIDLEVERDRGLLQFNAAPAGRNLDWSVHYWQENRSGRRPFGTSFGFNNAVQTAQPVEYTTHDLGARVEMPIGNGIVTGSLVYNEFSNDYESYVFDNPFRAVDATDPLAYLAPSGASVAGASFGRVSLPADNDALTASVGGLWRFNPTTRLTADVSFSQWSSNPDLIPFTTNDAIVTPPLPVQSLDADIDTLSARVKFVTRPLPRLSITALYDRYDLNNDTPRIRFEEGYVRYDAVWEDIPRITVPFEWSRDRAEAMVGYDFGMVDLEAGVRYIVWNREFRDTEETTEDIWRIAADVRPTEWALLRLAYETGSRDYDHYDPIEAEHHSFLLPGPGTNLPLIRRFDQSRRDLDLVNVSVQLTPLDAFTFGVDYRATDQDFTETVYGLIESDYEALSLQADYTPSDRLTIFAFADRESDTSFQRGRQSGATPSVNPLDDWIADIENDADTFGLGTTLGLRPGSLTLNILGRYQEVDGYNALFSPPGGTPDVAFDVAEWDDTQLWSISAELIYRLTQRWNVAVGTWFEDYQIEDAATTRLLHYMPGAFMLAPDNGDYDGGAAFVRATYKF